MTSSRAAKGFALAVIAAGCAGRGAASRVAPEPGCEPVTSRLAASAPWDSLAGTWGLRLVAAEGPMTGRAVSGRLTLGVQGPSQRRVERPGASDTVTVPIIGTLDASLERVGAERVGNLLSADPERPGLAIWVSRGADGGVSAVLRIGEEQIHSDLVRFEGAYTVLYLRQVSATGIYGGWASGGASGQEASGYFCATRATP